MHFVEVMSDENPAVNLYVLMEHFCNSTYYAAGEGEDDVQLILGDEKVETLDCADDLQLAIEDVFDDIEVVQTVDLDATDQDFEIDPAFNGKMLTLLVLYI